MMHPHIHIICSIFILLLAITSLLAQPDCLDLTGRRYSLGQTWTSACNNYRCEHDGARITTPGCLKADNTCFYQGETYNYHCFTYRCNLENGRAVREETYAGCTKSDGSCYAVGETYKYYCYQYRCTLKGGLPRREMVGQACSYFDRCITVGQTVIHGRRQFRCSSRQDGRLAWDRVNQNRVKGCRSNDGSVVPEGGTIRNECSIFKCLRTGRDSHQLQLQQTGCKNHRSECVSVGSPQFPCYINNQYSPRCVCRENNGGEAILASAAAIRPETFSEVSSENLRRPTCEAPNRSQIGVGQALMIDCITYRCVQNDVTGVLDLKLIDRNCRTFDGRCVRPGTTTFPCVHEGRRQSKCMCSRTGDGELVYTTMPENCLASDGNRVLVGDRHVIDCVTYQCREDGTMLKISQGCKNAFGRCVRLGAENFPCIINNRRVEKCKCLLSFDGKVLYLADKMEPLRCMASDGSEVDVGYTKRINCTHYRCTKEGNTLRLIPEKVECVTADKACVPIGTKNFPCSLNNNRQSRCQCDVDSAGTLVYTEHIQRQGCLTADGSLVAEGQTVDASCSHHVCQRTGNELQLKPLSVECMGSNGRCYPIGTEDFPCTMKGVDYPKCTCQLDESTRGLRYSASPNQCISKDGTKVPIGSEHVVDCTVWACIEIGDKLVMDVLSSECQTSSGQCVKIGSENFSCIIDDMRHENCKCSRQRSGEIVYTALVVKPVRRGCTTPSGAHLHVGEKETFDCVEYECVAELDRDILKPIEIECKSADGGCVPLDTVGFPCDIRGRRYDRCRCNMDSEHRVLYSALASECIANDGTSVKINNTYTKNCLTFKCEVQGNGLAFSSFGNLECRRSDGSCVPLGTSEFECEINGITSQHCTCELSEEDVIVYYINGCTLPDGSFLLRNGKQIVDCIEYECLKDNVEWVVKPILSECKTADNRCVRLGSSGFPCTNREDGQRFENCRCDLDAQNNIVYSVLSSGCNIADIEPRDVYEDTLNAGQSVTSNCKTYTCSKENDGYALRLVNTECITRDGSCRAIGSVDFSCQLGDHCRCKLDERGEKIIYSMYGCSLASEYIPPAGYLETNCTEYTCLDTGNAYNVQISQRIGCQGQDRKCHPPGSAPFVCEINGSINPVCQCERDSEDNLVLTFPTEGPPEPTQPKQPVEVQPIVTEKPKNKRKAGNDDTVMADCHFPFTSDGEQHDDCIVGYEANSRAWCPLTSNYPDDASIGYCYPKTIERKTEDGVPCKFPFIYGGLLYYDCVDAWSDWCSTTANYDIDGLYGTCAL